MKKIFVLAILLLLSTFQLAVAADAPISSLTNATPALTDYMVIVDDPAGTASSKRITIQALADAILADMVAGDVPDISVTYQAKDGMLDDISALTDPGADRGLFWDNSAGDIVWLTIGTGLSITGTTLSAAGTTTFTGMSDTPANFTGAGGYAVMVNSTPDALEFVDVSGWDQDSSNDFDGAWGSLSSVPAAITDIENITFAQGDILYWNGTDLVNLGPGTDGYFLKTQGAAANPVWAAPPGGGDITAVGDCDNGDCFTDGGTGSQLIFEGTANAYETILVATDATEDVEITLPVITGTVVLGPAAFGTDNRLTKTNGTGNLTQITGITVDDSQNVSGIGTLATSGLYTASAGITITTGQALTLGVVQWDNGSDLMDGEQIADDTIDDDSIDWSNVTAADITMTDAGAITSSAAITVGTNLLPDTANGAVLGSATAEFSDLYLADGAVIYFGADQDVTLTHVADTGLNLNEALSVADDKALAFGGNLSGYDWTAIYDETTSNRLEFTHTAGADADVYWDLNDSAADSVYYITNSDATYEANLDVEGSITATRFISDAADGDRYLTFGNNTSGNQPTTSTVATGQYSYETNMYFVVNDSIHSVFTSGGDIYLYGATDDNGFEYQIDITDPTADRVITIDDDNINFTAGAGEDNYVLKYDNSTNTWAAEADSTGSALGSNLSSATINISSDTGEIQLNGTGNTNNEDLDFDFETAANTVGVSSDTGVTLVDFGGIGLAGGSLDLSEGNITNAGTISIDAIAADATNVIFGSSAATQLQFRDSAIYIASLDDGHLDLEADTSVDINAPLVVGGNMTIPDAGNIGSASDTDAIAISAGGEVTFSQEVQAGAGIDVSGGTLVVGTISGTMTDGTASWNGSTQALTGFATFETDAAEINGTITLANDETIANSTDTQILFSANGGENLAIDLDTATDNEINISSPGGADEIDFSALNLVTTGTVRSRIHVATDADGKTLDKTTECNGTMQMATGAGTWVLPDIDDADGTGWSVCIYSTDANAVVVDPNAEDTITLDGTTDAAGDSITSASGAGDFICLVVTSVSSNVANWTTLGRSGTWTAD